MNILFVHLLNNYSGSPRVLCNILQNLSLDKEFQSDLLTSRTDGCLSNIKNITYIDNGYAWKRNKITRSALLVFSQILQFFKILAGKSYDVYYINTLLPFGAALAAKLKKRRVVYHIHEVYINPSIFHKVCILIMRFAASDVIAVSDYVKKHYEQKIKCNFLVINNTVSEEWLKSCSSMRDNKNLIQEKFNNKLIIMPTGLKKYKGIDLFVKLSDKNPEYTFLFILGCSESEAKNYFKGKKLPHNLEIIYQEKNMIDFYKNASIVLNLTIPCLTIETFGMTLIEGLSLGTPCIAPNAGGPKEIIEQGYNGFLVDPTDIQDISCKMHLLLDNFASYSYFFDNAIISSIKYKPNTAVNKVKSILRNGGESTKNSATEHSFGSDV